MSVKFSENLQHRTWRQGGKSCESKEWYGRWKPQGAKNWKWEKFYADKRASEKKWEEFKTEQEQRAAGVITLEMDHAQREIPEHIEQYIAAMKLENRSEDHQRISAWMLRQLVEGCGWKRVADITADSLRRFITTKAAAGDSVEYIKKWITRAKAFVHWMMREGRIGVDPLAGVKRPNSAKARKPRDRRPFTDAEFAALFHTTPECRRWRYAWPYLTGFRRGEMLELTEGDLRLNAPIPFIQLRAEWTKNSKNDVLPIHPRLAEWLREQASGDDNRHIFPSVPDMKTMARDMLRAGIATDTTNPGEGVSVGDGKYAIVADAKGRRLDFHALRHSYGTNLDRAGVSHATRKALMRHADTDITDGYSHARLAELAAAIVKLTIPAQGGNEASAMTGTDDQEIAIHWTQTGHGARTLSHSAAQMKPDATTCDASREARSTLPKSAVYNAFHQFAQTILSLRDRSAKVAKTRPSTQVD